MKPSILHMAAALIAASDESELEFFASIPAEELPLLNNSVGLWVRNEFKLWQYEWIPEIDERGVDCSPAHPDQVSMAVIKLAHMMVKNS